MIDDYVARGCKMCLLLKVENINNWLSATRI